MKPLLQERVECVEIADKFVVSVLFHFLSFLFLQYLLFNDNFVSCFVILIPSISENQVAFYEAQLCINICRVISSQRLQRKSMVQVVAVNVTQLCIAPKAHCLTNIVEHLMRLSSLLQSYLNENIFNLPHRISCFMNLIERTIYIF